MKLSLLMRARLGVAEARMYPARPVFSPGDLSREGAGGCKGGLTPRAEPILLYAGVPKPGVYSSR